MAVLILNGQVKPPEIASVLVGRVLVAFVYNPKLHPVREGRRHPGQVEEAEPDTLEEALKILSGDGEDTRVDRGLRNLSWNDPLDLARAIRHQITEPKSRYPKVSEQHQLKRAKKLLAEELSVVLELPEENIAYLIEGSPATDSKVAVKQA